MPTSEPLENRARRPITQSLVRSLLVVESQPRIDPSACLDHRAIRLDKHLFLFQAPPQAFDEDVVQEPALAIHADPDALTRKRNVSTTLIHPGSEFKLVSRPSAGIAQGQGRYPAFVPDPAG